MKNLILLTRRNNLSAVSKSLARYQSHPTTYPSDFPKPMSPWDNLDPGRNDKTLIDEFDKIDRKLVPGSEAPNAWRARKEFPEYYRPYLLNYQGHGYLIVIFSFFTICYYLQREQIKKIKGRRVLKDYSHEKKIIYTPFINLRLIKDLKSNPDSVFKYTERYIKESGF